MLTRNINGTGAPAIQINTINVDLDLNGFYIDGAGGTAIQVLNANELRVHDGVLQNVGLGIDVSNVFRVIVEDVRIHNAATDGIRLTDPNNYVIRRVQITSTGPAGDGIRVNSPAVGRIESCQLQGGGGRAISILGGNPVAIVDNVITNFSGEGIYLEGCNGGLVTGNSVTRSGGGQGGIYVWGSYGLTLSNNSVSRNKFHGIHVGQGSSGILVEGNVIRENGSQVTPGDGILVGGIDVMLINNSMTANWGVGLHFTSTSYAATFGRNTSRNNIGFVAVPCTAVPALFFPDSCNDGIGNNTSFGDNLIPGPLF